MVKQLFPYMKKYALFMLLGPLCVIGEVLLEVRIPILMSTIVDVGIATSDVRLVVRTGVLMVGMALLSLLCGVLSAHFSSKAAMGFGSELRRGLFDRIQEFSFSNIDKFSTASLVTRLTADVTNTQNAFLMSIRVLVRAPVMLVSATIMAASINRELVGVFLVAIPVLAVLLGVIATTAYPRFQRMLKKYDGLNASVQENLIAARVVKAFVRGDHEKEKFHDANDALMQASLSAERIVSLNMPMMQLTIYSCIIAILWFGGRQIIVGTMETGQLISFISYVTQILMSLMTISMVFVNIIISRASLGRISEVLAERPAIEDGVGAEGRPAEAEDGSIVFEDVSFRYNPQGGEDILKHVNLTIHSGETIGVIGGTGSAKTTLTQLIPRLYDATEGRVLVGGHDVREYRLADLRAAVGMVLQKNVLFSGTIRENLRWGNEQAGDEELIAACRAAAAHDFIMSLPDGYDTDLGQGGVNLSGGQKQRLCIARALVKKPRILILDDSTSAVDTATDAQIRGALRREMEGTTAIIIAQRIASVMDADRILVLDEGEIRDFGTHDELMARSAIYREVYESQQKGVA